MKFEVTRKIDALGRIVLPIDYRKSLDLIDGDDVIMTITEGKITIEKAKTENN